MGLGLGRRRIHRSDLLTDYKIIRPNAIESVSQAFLTGRGERSYFDLRFMHFYGFFNT